MDKEANDWKTFGSQRVRIDGYCVIIHYSGVLNLDEHRRILALAEQVIATYGYVYFIGDVEHVTTVTMEARRDFFRWAQTHPIRGFANIKASLFARTIGSLMQNGMRLLTGILPPNCYVDNEAEAYKWVSEQQQNYQSKKSDPKRT